MKDLSVLEQKMGTKFENKELLLEALTHRSFLNESRSCHLRHNERLEFLGDAVLELIISQYLFHWFPDKMEGDLTKMRAALVSADTAKKIAEDLGINDFIFLARGERQNPESRSRKHILANAFEAIIGALYLDQGLMATEAFVKSVLLSKLDQLVEIRDAKSEYQDKTQKSFRITPTYRVLKERGQDHAKIFTIGVYLENKLMARGEGLSKQEAENIAATAALDKLPSHA